MKSLPNIKTPTKCNDEVLSNSDVKSLHNMLNTNWTQDLNKITDPNMKKKHKIMRDSQKGTTFENKVLPGYFNDSH